MLEYGQVGMNTTVKAQGWERVVLTKIAERGEVVAKRAKLTDKQKKRIVVDYVETQNYSETARRNKTSATTVKRIVDADKTTLKKVEHKKEQNTVEILEALGSQTPKVIEFIDLSLDRLKEALPYAKNVRDIATAVGIMIDKYTAIAPKNNADDGPFEMPAGVIAPAFQSVFLALADELYTEYELAGGRGATKSTFVALCIVWLMKNNKDFHTVCIRKVGNTLRDSVFAQIIWAIAALGLDADFDSTVSPMVVTLSATGQKIYFRGADDPGKLKSITPPFGYVGVLWFEELDQFAGDNEVRNIRQSVIRGGDKAFVFKSYNQPKSINNWVNMARKMPKPGRLVHESTYLGPQKCVQAGVYDLAVPRKWLGQPFLDEAEYLKTINPDAYEHEYMGVANGSGGLVFEKIVLREISKDERKTFDRIYKGVDWGYYPDPWAFNDMHFDAARRVLYIFGELTRYKASNQQTEEALREYGVGDNDRITADSAEPKSVQDYKNWGLFCKGAEKGPGSVDYSMKWLQGLTQIVIDPIACPNTAKEFTGYEYERTKDGEIISGYPDANNHHIDAVRYAMEPVWKRRGQ